MLLTVLVIGALGFTCINGVDSTGSGAAKNIKLGLDLAGGVSITYEAEGDPTKEQMKDTVYKLQKRVEGYSTEALVYQEGSDRINIEIPGVSDANKILEELGKPGSLEFQNEDGETILAGTDIKTAEAGTQSNSTTGSKDYVVQLTLTDEGAKKFAEVTEANIGKRLPIVYDGEVISAPTVQSAITGGEAYITHLESFEAADNLASTIRIGALSVERAAVQDRRCPAGTDRHFHQRQSRYHRSDLCVYLYVYRIPDSRSGSQPGAGCVYRAHAGTDQCL